MYPCYSTYIILSPTELITLKVELQRIKDQWVVTDRADCNLDTIYNTIAEVVDKKQGLFVYTTD